jgi:hypothetical protein
VQNFADSLLRKGNASCHGTSHSIGMKRGFEIPLPLFERCHFWGTLFRACLQLSSRKPSKLFSLIDCISVGVDRMQRNFELMRKRVEAWPTSELTEVTAFTAHSLLIFNA